MKIGIIEENTWYSKRNEKKITEEKLAGVNWSGKRRGWRESAAKKPIGEASTGNITARRRTSWVTALEAASRKLAEAKSATSDSPEKRRWRAAGELEELKLRWRPAKLETARNLPAAKNKPAENSEGSEISLCGGKRLKAAAAGGISKINEARLAAAGRAKYGENIAAPSKRNASGWKRGGGWLKSKRENEERREKYQLSHQWRQ